MDFDNNFFKLLYKKNLFENLKYLLIFLKISFMSNALFLIILYVCIIIF